MHCGVCAWSAPSVGWRARTFAGGVGHFRGGGLVGGAAVGSARWRVGAGDGSEARLPGPGDSVAWSPAKAQLQSPAAALPGVDRAAEWDDEDHYGNEFMRNCEEGEMRATRSEVDLDAIGANLASIRGRVGAERKVMAVLKGNAYGHGIVPVARFLERCGVDAIAVALLEEGILLRRRGITCEVMALTPPAKSQMASYLRHNVVMAIPSVEKLKAAREVARREGKVARVHLELDTGMERWGTHYFNARNLLSTAFLDVSEEDARAVKVEGVFTHFASSDAQDLAFARLQLQRFEEALKFFEEGEEDVEEREEKEGGGDAGDHAGGNVESCVAASRRRRWPRRQDVLIHAANSGAVLQLPESWYDMVRPGILLYGVSPAAHCCGVMDIRPALSLKSTVTYFKVVQAGVPISYGGTYAPAQQSRVVTVPVGYADGYPRSLSNKGHVLIRGKRYPVVGSVCMDSLMVDLGPQGEAWNGDEVILIGEAGNGSDERITIEEVSNKCGTIPYEALTSISARVPRIYPRGAPREGRQP